MRAWKPSLAGLRINHGLPLRCFGGLKTKLLSTYVLIRLLCNSLCSATSCKCVFVVSVSKSVIPHTEVLGGSR